MINPYQLGAPKLPVDDRSVAGVDMKSVGVHAPGTDIPLNPRKQAPSFRVIVVVYRRDEFEPPGRLRHCFYVPRPANDRQKCDSTHASQRLDGYSGPQSAAVYGAVWRVLAYEQDARIGQHFQSAGIQSLLTVRTTFSSCRHETTRPYRINEA